MSLETMTKLASVTVGAGGTSNITFENIPQNYTDLKLVCSVRTNGNVINFNEGGLRFNRDVVSSNSSIFLVGTGTSATSASVTSDYIPFGPNQGSLTTANTFTSNEAYIINYSSFNYKSVILEGAAENNASAGRATLTSGLWSNPSPITVVAVFPGGGYNFVQHSTVTLYGIKNARQTAGNSIKATGGNIAFDGTYVYHVFPTTGTFTPTQSILADILVVAGGGGGGNTVGGGGGAGGLLGYANQYLTSNTTYVTTVGAGGGSTSSGSNSQFSSLSASIGGGGGGDYNSGSDALSGGSGGGGGFGEGFTISGGSGTAGPPRQGYNGGSGGSTQTSGAFYTAGGGGGAGGAGANAVNNTTAGDGGVGSSAYSSWGIATGQGQNIAGVYYFAGGGAGASSNGQYGGGSVALGGFGGGGNGGINSPSTSAIAGRANTGGGGGGQRDAGGGQGAAGGSGIIIIRYKG